MDERSAVISECGRYRYRLTRRWADGPTAAFAMLNPSTADHQVNDPTITRCVGFARAWGYGALDVVNQFAWRATDPDVLRKLDYLTATGPDNARHIKEVCEAADIVIAAWGAHPLVTGRTAIAHLNIHQLAPAGRVYCLGLTKAGAPRHPLYVPASTQPILFGGHR